MSDAARNLDALPAEDETVLMRFAGQVFQPLPSGGLFWPAQNALLVADLHLEKLSSFARLGQMLPPYDTAMTLHRLAADIARTRAQTLIALGDSFHRDEGVATLLEADRARIDALSQQVDWIWLSGNHDPAPHALGGQCYGEIIIDGMTLTHEPRRGAAGLLAGHLHPAARVVANGRTVRRPCFVHDNRLMILPAYGASTGSINIMGPAFRGLLNWPSLEVAMIGKDRVYPVSPRRLAAG